MTIFTWFTAYAHWISGSLQSMFESARKLASLDLDEGFEYYSTVEQFKSLN